MCVHSRRAVPAGRQVDRVQRLATGGLSRTRCVPLRQLHKCAFSPSRVIDSLRCLLCSVVGTLGLFFVMLYRDRKRSQGDVCVSSVLHHPPLQMCSRSALCGSCTMDTRRFAFSSQWSANRLCLSQDRWFWELIVTVRKVDVHPVNPFLTLTSFQLGFACFSAFLSESSMSCLTANSFCLSSRSIPACANGRCDGLGQSGALASDHLPPVRLQLPQPARGESGRHLELLLLNLLRVCTDLVAGCYQHDAPARLVVFRKR